MRVYMNQNYDYRCQSCNKLLFKGNIEKGVVEVKCDKCGTVNVAGATVKEELQKIKADLIRR